MPMRCYAPAQLITERRSWRRFDNRLHTYSITPNPNERFRIPSGLAKEVRALSGTRRTRIPVFDRRPIPRQAWSRPGKTPPNSLCRAVSSGRLTKLRLLAALVGALVHVFNHPGTNNGHEARARTERARTHMDSVLERHQIACPICASISAESRHHRRVVCLATYRRARSRRSFRRSSPGLRSTASARIPPSRILHA
jgi:hypothetical protein